MRCSKCGGYVPENDLRIYNGSVMCANCFDEICQGKIGRVMDDFFNIPLEKTAGMIFNMSNLDFGNSALTCPKCGMSLKEIETEKKVGCIECINFFNNEIAKILLKDQGSTEYLGRLPAQYEAESLTSDEEEIREVAAEEAVEDIPEEDAAEDLNIQDKELGELTEEQLNKGLAKAVKAEDYILAARIRDELNRRKEGSGS